MGNIEKNYIKQLQKDIVRGYIKADINYYIKNLTLNRAYKGFEVKNNLEYQRNN